MTDAITISIPEHNYLAVQHVTRLEPYAVALGYMAAGRAGSGCGLTRPATWWQVYGIMFLASTRVGICRAAATAQILDNCRWGGSARSRSPPYLRPW